MMLSRPAAVLDAAQRPLLDLRISVTDRCNFRCAYCMPKEVFGNSHKFLPHSEILSFEEMLAVAAAHVDLGVEKIRLTGGEPLMRKHIEVLIAGLARLRNPQGQALPIKLTTNGALLARQARNLKAAGLTHLTVSLDALDDACFRQMNDVDFPVAEVLQGIAVARDEGFEHIKINAVIRRGVNDHQIEPLAHWARQQGPSLSLRFIEFMDVGESNGWRLDQVLPSREVLDRLKALAPLRPLDRDTPQATAERWAWEDGRGEIGLISSVTQAFCGQCSRARLSIDGHLYPCLFACQGLDMRPLLRSGASHEELCQTIRHWWSLRQDRYSMDRLMSTPGRGDPKPDQAPMKKIEMHYIGG